MDNIKSYAKNDDVLEGLVSNVKRFSDDIGMQLVRRNEWNQI